MSLKMTLRAVPTTRLVTPSQPTHSAGTCGTAEYASEKTQKLVCARRPSSAPGSLRSLSPSRGELLPSHGLGQRVERLAAALLRRGRRGQLNHAAAVNLLRPDFFVGAHRSSISPVCEQNFHFQE